MLRADVSFSGSQQKGPRYWHFRRLSRLGFHIRPFVRRASRRKRSTQASIIVR
jgi:hypothetical protein